MVINTLTDVQCGQLAMAIDTDGSIYMCVHKHGKEQKPSIGTYVAFTNQSKRLIKYIKSLIGGRVVSHMRKGTFILVVEAKDEIMNALKQIYRFLIRKQKQAFLMMNFFVDRGYGKPYTQRDWRTIVKMKRLNRMVN